MSIRNMLTAALFKRDEVGRTVMYPNGAMGRGYLVPDAATEERMRRTLLWLVLGAGLTGGVGAQVMTTVFGQMHTWAVQPWAIAAAALAAFGIAYRVLMRRLTRDMTPVEQRMGLREALRRQAEAMPSWYLWFIAVLAPLLVMGSALWMIDDHSPASYVLGSLGMLLFAALTMQAVHGLSHRRRAS